MFHAKQHLAGPYSRLEIPCQGDVEPEKHLEQRVQELQDHKDTPSQVLLLLECLLIGRAEPLATEGGGESGPVSTSDRGPQASSR